MKLIVALTTLLGLASAHQLFHYPDTDGGQCTTQDRSASDSAYSSYTACLKNLDTIGWFKPEGCTMNVQLFSSTDCSGDNFFTYQLGDGQCTSEPTGMGARSAKGICV